MPSPLNCPTCRKPLPASDTPLPFRPFCSSRCKMADLGSWLGESYRISSPLSEEDLDQGLATDGDTLDKRDAN